jgi:hypothetical protein
MQANARRSVIEYHADMNDYYFSFQLTVHKEGFILITLLTSPTILIINRNMPFSLEVTAEILYFINV